MRKQEADVINMKLDALIELMEYNKTALGTIAARLGFLIDVNGEYLMESDGVDTPLLRLQDNGTLTAAPPSPGLDVDTCC